MKTLALSPYFGTSLPVETSLAKADRLRTIVASRFGEADADSIYAVPRIMALCESVVPDVQPDIPLRYALSSLHLLHPSKRFSNPEARKNMPFANDALDLRLGNLRPRIIEIMDQCSSECTSAAWPINVCTCIESIWEAEGFNQRIEVADYGDGYRIDATGIAIDVAREQINTTPEVNTADQLINAMTLLMCEETTDFTGIVSDQFRAWCKNTFGLESVKYTHLLSLVASKVPLLLVRG